MLFTVIMGLFAAILYLISFLLPTVDYGSTSIFGEMVQGAQGLIAMFPPFATMFQVVTVLISVQVVVYGIGQLYNVFNWIRGAGSLKLHN